MITVRWVNVLFPLLVFSGSLAGAAADSRQRLYQHRLR